MSFSFNFDLRKNAFRGVLYGLVFLLPLFFVPFGIENFDIPKSNLFLVGCLVLAFLVPHDRLSEYLESAQGKTILAIFGAYLCISLFGVNFDRSLFGERIRGIGILSILALIVFSYAVYVSKSKEKLLKISSISVFFCSMIGILFWVLKFFSPYFDNWLYDGRIVSTLGHPNTLAFVIMYHLSFVYLFGEGSLSKIMYLAFIVAVFLTYSRVAFATLFIYLLFKKNRMVRIVFSKKALTACLFLFFISFIYLGVFNSIYEFLRKRPYLYQLQRFGFVLNTNNITDEPRIKLIKLGFEALSKRPILGYGLGNVEIAYNNIVFNRDEFSNLAIDSSHNILMDTALQVGLSGLIFLLISIFINIRKIVVDYHQKSSLIFILIFFLFNPPSISVLYLIALLAS
jgi:hypothetical protein